MRKRVRVRVLLGRGLGTRLLLQEPMEGGLDSRLAGPVPLPSVAGTYSRLAGQLRWLLKHDVKFQISCDPYPYPRSILEQTVPWGRRQMIFQVER